MKRIKEFFLRLRNLAAFAIAALKYRSFLTPDNLHAMAEVYQRLMFFAGSSPRLGKLTIKIKSDDGAEEDVLLQFWVAKGRAASPFKRIKELTEEINSLKQRLK